MKCQPLQTANSQNHRKVNLATDNKTVKMVHQHRCKAASRPKTRLLNNCFLLNLFPNLSYTCKNRPLGKPKVCFCFTKSSLQLQKFPQKSLTFWHPRGKLKVIAFLSAACRKKSNEFYHKERNGIFDEKNRNCPAQCSGSCHHQCSFCLLRLVRNCGSCGHHKLHLQLRRSLTEVDVFL